jgi:nicotinamide mononucleotide adenylyltransferase
MSDVNKFMDSESPFTGTGKHAVFIGRWQPMHNGHIWLFNQKLDKGIPILIMIRDIESDDKNPFTSEETQRLIHKIFEGKQVKTMIIPDIESVNWGRGVGYEVNEFEPPDDIKQISATFIRNSIKEGNDEWKNFVPETIHTDVYEYLNEFYGV